FGLRRREPWIETRDLLGHGAGGLIGGDALHENAVRERDPEASARAAPGVLLEQGGRIGEPAGERPEQFQRRCADIGARGSEQEDPRMKRLLERRARGAEGEVVELWRWTGEQRNRARDQ